MKDLQNHVVMELKYLVIVEKTDTGYSAFLPDFPGCITVADTKEEIESSIKEAISLHIEGLQEDGIDIPMPSTQAFTTSVSKSA